MTLTSALGILGSPTPAPGVISSGDGTPAPTRPVRPACDDV